MADTPLPIPSSTRPGLARRWRWILAVTSLVALAAILLASQRCPQPDFEADAEQLEARLPEAAHPIFLMPAADADHNGIKAVFVDERGDGRLELNVIWEDEDVPLPIFDPCYDGFRWYYYGRVMDVETLIIDPRSGALDLPGTWAGDQSSQTLFPEHFSKRSSGQALRKRAGRPLIPVLTWNHLFGCEPLEDPSGFVEVADYPLYQGSRSDVEALFRTVHE